MTYKCLNCGATTTDPSQKLIKWFHADCPNKKGGK